MKHIILIFLLTLIFSCKDSEKQNYSAFEKQMEAKKHPGKKLMEKHCYVCHNPSARHDNRIAPPMIAVKKHYIDKNTSKEDFIKSMQAWINNPNKEDAKMFGAVKRFGVMPKQVFPKEDIMHIAEYIYDFDIDQPEWFEDHFNEEKKNHKKQGKHKKQTQNTERLSYGERGMQYALKTKAVLGKNLMGTIQKHGTLAALSFCNERAYPLTDSMSIAHNTKIKRVTDRPRNPVNSATAQELLHIETFKTKLLKNENLEPLTIESDDKVNVYYPIITNSMCLQCHGKPNDDIKPEVIKQLTLLYPKDKATGYKTNEVRGIWSIEFNK